MQQTDPTQQETAPRRRARNLTGHLRRFLLLYLAIVALLLLALLPPLINVNRFQRRIATSISGSLGRPVHLDRVSLSLLPLPAFTLENFVVSEDPAFGSEPIIRANSVRATLRISSLWRRRVEFSTISFTSPSVNLVHNPDGKWNIESILLQASRIPAAPTAQTKAGPTPRFPYIEATDARLNLKQGPEKTPFSLTEAEFALWLPNPEQWHLRLTAHPARTDLSTSDTGTIHVEATLGHATSLAAVPIEATGDWRDAPLGEATRVLLGRDAEWRGSLTLESTVQGTVGANNITTRLRINDARRADFIPDQSLSVDLSCRAHATQAFHSFAQIHCSWPPNASPGNQSISLSGEMPDIRQWQASRFETGVDHIPASTLVDWWHVLSARPPEHMTAGGTLTGSLAYDGTGSTGTAQNEASPNRSQQIEAQRTNRQQTSRQQAGTPPAQWSGEMVLTGATLKTPETGNTSLLLGNIVLRSPERPTLDTRPTSATRSHRSAPSTTASLFLLEPVQLALGGREPAQLEGQVDANGYTLHLTGTATTARLHTLTQAIPQLGDGLEAALPTSNATTPIHLDLTATRTWGTQQEWHPTTSHPTPTHPHRH